MATDGTPEMAAKRCGDAIARLRTMRRWSRAQLVIRLYDELSPDDPNYDSISETWLARLENGRMVKVPRCRALRCSPQERAHVLLHADRNVLAEDADPPTPVAELLTLVMDRLYNEAYEALCMQLGPRQATALDEQERFEMAAAALDLVMARRHRQAVGAYQPSADRGPAVPREGHLAPQAAQPAGTGAAFR